MVRAKHIYEINFLYFLLLLFFPSSFLLCVRASDEKEIDFAEQLESVAYVLCGEGPITFEKFISIWNARGVSSNSTCILKRLRNKINIKIGVSKFSILPN